MRRDGKLGDEGMTQQRAKVKPAADEGALREPRPLTPAAQRALAEAEQRRRLQAEAERRPAEVNGRGGAEPVRFGDWEVKGLAVDF